MKYSLFIGRWQPWHDGHRWLIDQRLKLHKKVLVAVREVGKDDSNPYDPLAVKENIEKQLSDLISQEKVKVIIIPDIESINYGRGVGYEIIEHVPPQKIGQISAGETIKIQCPVKMQRTKSGTIRIPLVNGGWVTAQTKSGKALVEEYVCEIHENTPCCDGNEASFQSPPDVLASLKARKASLESTRKRIEETIEKSNAITNAAQEIEEQWKEFQDAFGQMNQAMVEKIGNSLMNDCKMRRILGLR